MEPHIMWIAVVAALLLLLIGVGLIYWLLKAMGESGVEAAAPGSCRSGRCGVTLQNRPGGECAVSPSAVASEAPSINEITRKDALSPKQIL
jgi:hypothetical protein